ncbi:MAG: hypothetical protein ACLR8Y_07065 [Alistipes indistinctus]
MPAVKGMIDAQRKAAEAAGVAFWNTFDAMGGENSMVNFVQRSGPRKTIRISVIRAANISRSVCYRARIRRAAAPRRRRRADAALPQPRGGYGQKRLPGRMGNTKGRNRIRLKAAQKRRQEPQQRTGNAAKRIKIQQGTVTGNGPEPELKPGQETGCRYRNDNRNRGNCGYKCRGGSHPDQPGCLRHARYDKDPS